jgi:hypothetical protein
MNISGEGIGSVVAEKCSPSHNSGKAEPVGQQRFLGIFLERFGK